MNLTTNSASTRDWIRATQNMRISAYDPGQKASVSPATPNQTPQVPERLKSDPRSPLPSRG